MVPDAKLAKTVAAPAVAPVSEKKDKKKPAVASATPLVLARSAEADEPASTDDIQKGSGKTNNSTGTSGKDKIDMTNTIFSNNTALTGEGDDVINQGTGDGESSSDSHHNNNDAEGGEGQDVINQGGDESKNTASEENDGSTDLHSQTGNHQNNTSSTGDGNDSILQQTNWSINNAFGGAGDDVYIVDGNNNINQITEEEEGSGDDAVSISGEGNELDVKTGDGNDEIQVGTTTSESEEEVGEGRSNTGTVDAGTGDDRVSLGKDGDGTSEVAIDGGEGDDTLVLEGAEEDWTITENDDGSTTYKTKNGDRVYTVTGFEGDPEYAAQAEFTDGAQANIDEIAEVGKAVTAGDADADPDVDPDADPEGAPQNADDVGELINGNEELKDATGRRLDQLGDGADLPEGVEFTGNVIDGGPQPSTSFTSGSNQYVEVEVDGEKYYAEYFDGSVRGETGAENSTSFTGNVLTPEELEEKGIIDKDGNEIPPEDRETDTDSDVPAIADDLNGLGDDGNIEAEVGDLNDPGAAEKLKGIELKDGAEFTGNVVDGPVTPGTGDESIQVKYVEVKDKDGNLHYAQYHDTDGSSNGQDVHRLQFSGEILTAEELQEEGILDENGNPVVPDTADEEDPDSSTPTESEAVQFILDNMGDGGDDKPDLNNVRGRTSDQGMLDLISQIDDGNDGLSDLDGDGGDLNRGELEGIKKLLDEGYTLEQLRTIGSRNDGTNLLETLDQEAAPAASDADKTKNTEGVRFILDEAREAGIFGEDKGDQIDDEEDWNELLSRTSDQDVKDTIGQIQDNEDALSELDGDGGALNQREIEGILALVEQGYSIEYLAQIGNADGEVNLLEALKDIPAPNPFAA